MGFCDKDNDKYGLSDKERNYIDEKIEVKF